ncbi:hypothetical protein ACMFMG_011729 [Clarireedia jacksonii]
MTSLTSPKLLRRRSHTKSRNGCATCKCRHIRCDETLPHCNNCTKYNCRCSYQDLPGNGQREWIVAKPDLMWTSQIETEIRSWQKIGRSSFLSLCVLPAILFETLSFEELRLIHHLASISSELSASNSSNFTIWVRKIPLFLEIGATYSFVMHSLLALSASHLAWLTGCSLTANMAFEHRGIALKGLYQAIGSFLRENSDAVLAASLLLSWQATEWRDWTRYMRGTSSIIDAMQPWKHESQLEDLIAEKSRFPIAPPSSDTLLNNAHLDTLRLASARLREVEAYLKGNMERTEAITQLVNFVDKLRTLSSSHNTTQRFDMLDSLRTWLLWLPVMYVQQTRTSVSAFVVPAYYYTIALIVEPLFPEIGPAYFGSLSLNPIEEIARQLVSFDSCKSSQMEHYYTALNFMAYPIDTVCEFRTRTGLELPEWVALLRQFIYTHHIRAKE